MAEWDIQKLEEKYRDVWPATFEADPDEKDKFYLNVAFPYPSGAMHVGHGRTYIVPDVVARFWRMQDKNVLFPMAFHVTGTPVIGISKRIAKGDPDTVRLYRDLYQVPEDVLAKFDDPMTIVRYFAGDYERIMRRCGLSIDWRRRFITVDPQYSKYIEWQYAHLKEGEHVVKGVHPVKYCPSCDNPVGDHDLLEGEKAEIMKFTLILFEWQGAKIPCATLRPETIYGVTNLWANPEVMYLRAKVDGEAWVLSREAAYKLEMQDHTIEVTGEVSGAEIVGSTASHPLCGEVPVLPAAFVDPDMGSGLVMSVPAHAPFDYIALRDLQEQGEFTGITPVAIITSKGYGDLPAKDAIERAGITHQLDPRMDEVTREVYGAELLRGTLLPNCGEQAGKPVKQARDDVAALMLEEYGSKVMFEFDTSDVVCRCGGRVYVKILHDQWFLQYSDPAWKAQVHQQIDEMKIVPQEVRAEFDRTVDWLKDWACTRRVGLGTKLPWDTNWIIEPLSDSTLYMAFYTIAHHIKKIEPEKLTPEVFDYIIYGTGNPTTVPRATLDAIRAEFLYWYPYNYRFSAKDLISNHLTFQLFHHRAVMEEDKQPQGMVIFGMGLLNGAKMSSSKGNVVLLDDALNEFGPDTVRMFLVGSAEPWQDFDWRNELVIGAKKQIERFWNTVSEGIAVEENDGREIDGWLISRLQHRIENTTLALQNFQTRQALQEAFFGIEADLKWYRRRLPTIAPGSAAVQELCSAWVRLLAPVVPYTSEELWHQMGHDEPVAFAPWPVADAAKIDEKTELAEEFLARTVEDIESIMRIIQMEPRAVNLYVAPAWKRQVFSIIAGAADPKQAVKLVMADEGLRGKGKEAADAAKQVTKFIHRLPPELVESVAAHGLDEMAVLSAAQEFLQREFNVPVRILQAEGSGEMKADAALPFKPAIVIE
ncbi:leucine--tRNA ligase [Methanofollis aquaemaris]|uniref:Leucine--tRNA ligase n=1 Tax=Methanofollis aquaemaris TaxID=126734 RepID=A0A8A3S578_9EURY|nr:leucine--tRNA ligase [Methanofollis aquaemaris]QSZ66774.1 leucine--tRNA ligase [Methanofollis aquaemaris]